MEEQTTNQAQEAENQAQESAPQGQERKPEQRTYTQEEFDTLFNARFARETAKWEKKLTESQKMAKMTAEQKAQYQSEQHEKELAEREANITRRELQATAKETLIERGLPAELFETLNYTDAESCTKSIDAVEKVFRAAVEKAVDDRIKKSGGTPKSGGTDSVSGVEAKFYELNPQLKQ